MGSPLKVITLSAVYWMVVMKWGRNFMENRKSYDLKKWMMVYNILQVVANVYIGYLGTLILLDPEYPKWSCNSTHFTPLTTMCYCYFLLKVSDYTDTIFMVLRKCNNQISFLHVYHHMIMVLGSYAGTRYRFGSSAVLVGYVNVWVHAVMYFYYFLTSFRPELKASLWWKKHITQLQILQFLFLLVFYAQRLMRSSCEKSKILTIFVLLQNIFMTVMFLDFYIKAYVRKPKRKEITK